VSHCDRIGQDSSYNYEIRFPFNEISGDVGYDIYKQTALFVAGGADPTEYFREREGENEQLLLSFAQSIRNHRKWTEATELIHSSEEESGIPGGYSYKKIDDVTSTVVQGQVNYVRQYLESSPESGIFLHGVQAWDIHYPDSFETSSDNDADDFVSPDKGLVQTSGKTALYLAAREMYPRIVELLLQKGANPNAADMNGRVPLVEAALWGRLENVKHLLKYGASKELDCVRNGQRLLLIDFARLLRSNSEERYVRSGGTVQVYKENTFERDLDRRAIVNMLKDEAEELGQDHYALNGFAFTKSPKDENLLTLVAHFDIPHKWKTIAVLYRGSQFPSVAAISGWGHQEDWNINIQVASKDWTTEVSHLCEAIQYSLAPHDYDQGEQGRYHAYHAEKQLIAFFVNKHLFLPHELEEKADLARLDLRDLPDMEYERREGEKRHKENLSSLKSMEPSISMKTATILVCRPICIDCMRFVRQVNLALGLNITIFHRCLENDCVSCRT
jgi:hypothetical protein